MPLEPYTLIEKKVGETPLEALEKLRASRPELAGTPLAYAGRLDPMASGRLLVLIGEECKNQTDYHNLDKEYQVEILFGVKSDSGDVLGLVTEGIRSTITTDKIKSTFVNLTGPIELPYPIFSSRTVQGKPLHTWAMENRLSEITIPTKKSEIYALNLSDLTTISRDELVVKSLAKIESIPPVTDPRKALGNDFRRPLVRKAWQEFLDNGGKDDIFYLAEITCICSSGTYMRTLAEIISERLDSLGLAFSIHRTKIGQYNKSIADWDKTF